MIGPLAPFVRYFCYLLFALLPCQKTTKNPFSKYSQGFPTPYHCSSPSAPCWDRHSYLPKVLRYTPILVGHQDYFLALLPGSEALLKSGTGKGNFYCEYLFLFLFVALFPIWITHLVFYLGKLLPLLG